MSEVKKLNKGFDINLAGKAESIFAKTALPETCMIKPDDFVGMYRPKVFVKEGETVKAGTPLFQDKGLEGVMYCSPVSGEVLEVKRGEQRKLLGIKVLVDKTIDYVPFQKYTLSELSNLKKEDVLPTMLQSGVWVQIIQRPYGVVADPNTSPKAIFISAFDSSPLAPDYEFLFKGQEVNFQAGLEVLSKIVKCPIHLGLNAKTEVSKVFSAYKNVKLHKFAGAHPAGNVGVHIHHVSPINNGELVWTLNPYGVIQIGKLFLEGKYDASRTVAVVGSEIQKPEYHQTFIGGCIDKLVGNNLKSQNVRFVSGNVLTGTKLTDSKDYLGFYDQQLTVIPEGNKPRFFLTEGWLAPVANRLSFHKALGLFSFLNPQKEYALDTSLNGEEWAFVTTGTFEKVVPMDIMPIQLLKAILANDYENMEALGIFEVIEEDLALCEFVDVSKQPVQAILREGLNMMREG